MKNDVPIQATERRFRGPHGRRARMRAKGEVISRWRRELADRLDALGIDGKAVVASDDEERREAVGFLERMLSTRDDLMSVRFLQRGAEITQAVCRIETFDEAGEHEAFGTGFLIASGVLLTNHHLLPDSLAAARCELHFGYDTAESRYWVFKAEPGPLFVTNEKLDYTLVAVNELSVGDEVGIAQFGAAELCPPKPLKLEQEVNIVQHPSGDPKQVAIRDNEVVDLLDDFIHYRTDTRQGSSGAPVCNDEWQVVAIHHSGVPRRVDGQIVDLRGKPWNGKDINDIDFVANEGVRIERVLADARQHVDGNDVGLMKILGGLEEALEEGRPARARRPAQGTIPQALIGPSYHFNPVVQTAALDYLEGRPLALPDGPPRPPAKPEVVAVTPEEPRAELQHPVTTQEPVVATPIVPVRAEGQRRIVSVTIPVHIELELGEPFEPR